LVGGMPCIFMRPRFCCFGVIAKLTFKGLFPTFIVGMFITSRKVVENFFGCLLYPPKIRISENCLAVERVPGRAHLPTCSIRLTFGYMYGGRGGSRCMCV